MYRTIVFIVLAHVLATPAVSSTPGGEYVYRIKAQDCGNSLEARVQTGFKLRGKAGIVTALHGVVGCNDLSAISESMLLKDLKIDEVDIARDLAFLSSNQLYAEDGLNITDQSNLYGEVRIIGHPQAISGIHEMALDIPRPAIRALRELVPAELWSQLQQRKSPQISVQVVSVNGNLQPGHSGAPILDTEDRAIGVASGGLGNGTLGIGWAIPISRAQWRPASTERSELSRLAKLGAQGLFWMPGQAGGLSHYPHRVSLWRYAEGRVSGIFSSQTGNTVYVNTFEKIGIFDFDKESTADISVGHLIQGMALSPDTRTAYVIDARPKNVLKEVDLVRHRVVREIELPKKKVCPPTMAPSGELLFVPLPIDNAFWVYNLRSKRGRIVPIDAKNPCAAIVSRRTGNVYISSSPNEIRVFSYGDFYNTKGMLSPKSIYRVGRRPTALAENFAGNRLYVSNLKDGTVSVVDVSQGEEIAVIGVGKGPMGIGLTQDSRWLYVANRGDASVSIIDTERNEVVETVLVDADPANVAISSDGNRIFIGHFMQNSVTLIE